MTETRVEYAVRYEDGVQIEATFAELRRAEHIARINADARGVPAWVVRRTVTYGEWEPVQ